MVPAQTQLLQLIKALSHLLDYHRRISQYLTGISIKDPLKDGIVIFCVSVMEKILLFFRRPHLMRECRKYWSRGDFIGL